LAISLCVLAASILPKFNDDWLVIDCENKDRVTVLGFIKTMVEPNVFGWAKAMSCFAAV